jgi:hypothetical protein
LLATLADQAHDGFGTLTRIADRIRRERWNMASVCSIDAIRDVHARSGRVGEVRVERLTGKTEELDRLVEIADREVHEDPGGHAGSSGRTGTS